MAHGRQLRDYPELQTWFAQLDQPPPPSDHSGRLVWMTCRVLKAEEGRRLKIWMDGLSDFLLHAPSAYDKFLAAEEILAIKGLDFMNLASDIAELAIRSHQGHDYFLLMQNSADKTELAAFRFIAAWTALNNDQLELCIQECDKIDQPFACVHTLHGQALLECGLADEAVDVLKIAVELDPQEVLAYFQLAKALYALERVDEAWEALCAAFKIQPGHPEIMVFALIMALESRNVSRIQACRGMLNESIVNLAPLCDTDILLRCFEVYFHSGSSQEFSNLLSKTDWSQLRRDPLMLQNTAWVLRTLDEKKWVRESSLFLRYMTEDSVSSTAGLN